MTIFNDGMLALCMAGRAGEYACHYSTFMLFPLWSVGLFAVGNVVQPLVRRQEA